MCRTLRGPTQCPACCFNRCQSRCGAQVTRLFAQALPRESRQHDSKLLDFCGNGKLAELGRPQICQRSDQKRLDAVIGPCQRALEVSLASTAATMNATI